MLRTEMDHNSRVNHLIPEQRLIAAILQRSVSDYLSTGTNGKVEENRQIARDWIDSEARGDGSHWTYVDCCEALSIEHKSFRTHLFNVETKEKKTLA